MSEPQPVEAKHLERRAAFWITLARSILTLALGLALIFHPDKTRPILVNFIGVFWLAAGIVSLRWGQRASEPGARPLWSAAWALWPAS